MGPVPPPYGSVAAEDARTHVIRVMADEISPWHNLVRFLAA